MSPPADAGSPRSRSGGQYETVGRLSTGTDVDENLATCLRLLDVAAREKAEAAGLLHGSGEVGRHVAAGLLDGPVTLAA